MKKLLKQARNRASKSLAVAGGAVLTAQQASASVLPSDFATVMGETETDITTVGGAIIGLAVVAMGIRWVKATFF